MNRFFTLVLSLIVSTSVFAGNEPKALQTLNEVLDNVWINGIKIPEKKTSFYTSCDNSLEVQYLGGIGFAHCVIWSLDKDGRVEYYPAKLYKAKIGLGAGVSIYDKTTVRVKNVNSLEELSGFNISVESGLILGGVTWASLSDDLGVTTIDGKAQRGFFADLLSVSPYFILRNKKAMKNGFLLNKRMQFIMRDCSGAGAQPACANY